LVTAIVGAPISWCSPLFARLSAGSRRLRCFALKTHSATARLKDLQESHRQQFGPVIAVESTDVSQISDGAEQIRSLPRGQSHTEILSADQDSPLRAAKSVSQSA
jgi:hypothetical protein